MMSCTASAHHVLSLCCTEYGPYRGAVLSGRITSIVMSMSGQLGQRCTIGTHCTVLHVYKCFSNARACLANTRA
jgi:hypothetical protein